MGGKKKVGEGARWVLFPAALVGRPFCCVLVCFAACLLSREWLDVRGLYCCCTREEVWHGGRAAYCVKFVLKGVGCNTAGCCGRR